MTPAQIAARGLALARHAWEHRDQAGNFAAAQMQWAASGFRLRSPESLAAVIARCEMCIIGEPPNTRPGWDPTAAGGLGACRVCHCPAWKRHQATSACPLGKWVAEPVQG